MNVFWHKPLIPMTSGIRWHVYNADTGASLCGEFQLIGLSRPKDARMRMPSRATAKVCETCEAKRPPTANKRRPAGGNAR